MISHHREAKPEELRVFLEKGRDIALQSVGRYQGRLDTEISRVRHSNRLTCKLIASKGKPKSQRVIARKRKLDSQRCCSRSAVTKRQRRAARSKCSASRKPHCSQRNRITSLVTQRGLRQSIHKAMRNTAQARSMKSILRSREPAAACVQRERAARVAAELSNGGRLLSAGRLCS